MAISNDKAKKVLRYYSVQRIKEPFSEDEIEGIDALFLGHPGSLSTDIINSRTLRVLNLSILQNYEETLEQKLRKLVELPQYERYLRKGQPLPIKTLCYYALRKWNLRVRDICMIDSWTKAGKDGELQEYIVMAGHKGRRWVWNVIKPQEEFIAKINKMIQDLGDMWWWREWEARICERLVREGWWRYEGYHMCTRKHPNKKWKAIRYRGLYKERLKLYLAQLYQNKVKEIYNRKTEPLVFPDPLIFRQEYLPIFEAEGILKPEAVDLEREKLIQERLSIEQETENFIKNKGVVKKSKKMRKFIFMNPKEITL